MVGSFYLSEPYIAQVPILVISNEVSTTAKARDELKRRIPKSKLNRVK